MSEFNNFLPMFVATGVAVVGCAAAFYFSDSDSSTKRRKKFPIHTKDFDDDLDSYDEDYTTQVKHRKKKFTPKDDSIDEDEDDEDEEEDDEDDEDDEEDEEEDEDEEDENPYLVTKRVKKGAVSKSNRR